MQKRLLWIVLLLVIIIGGGAIIYTFLNGGRGALPNLTPEPADREEIVIYFSKSKGHEMVTEGVIRQVPEERQDELVAYAVEELLEGPNQEESVHGYYSEIPKGTRIIAVSETPGEIRVNLSQQFTSGGGSASMRQRLAELTRTLRSVENEVPVYVDIEGQQLEVLGGEGVIVDEPVNRVESRPE